MSRPVCICASPVGRRIRPALNDTFDPIRVNHPSILGLHESPIDGGLMNALCGRRSRLGWLFLSLLLALPATARAGLVAEFTLSATAPGGFSGALSGNWTAEDRGNLPAFAKHTVFLAPAADYYVRAVGGGWDFAASEASGPNHTEGCDATGCDIGWLNLFFIHDDRGIAGQPGDETDAFGNPSP